MNDFEKLVAEFMALYELPDTKSKQLERIVGRYALLLRWSNDGVGGGSVMSSDVHKFHSNELNKLDEMCRSRVYNN